MNKEIKPEDLNNLGSWKCSRGHEIKLPNRLYADDYSPMCGGNLEPDVYGIVRVCQMPYQKVSK